MYETRRMAAALLGLSAIGLAGCTTSAPVDALGMMPIVGQSLPGAEGKTIMDQRRIDETMARLCGAGVYGSDLCNRHTLASAARRKELKTGSQ